MHRIWLGEGPNFSELGLTSLEPHSLKGLLLDVPVPRLCRGNTVIESLNPIGKTELQGNYLLGFSPHSTGESSRLEASTWCRVESTWTLWKQNPWHPLWTPFRPREAATPKVTSCTSAQVGKHCSWNFESHGQDITTKKPLPGVSPHSSGESSMLKARTRCQVEGTRKLWTKP